jgi:hypothetical protein
MRVRVMIAASLLAAACGSSPEKPAATPTVAAVTKPRPKPKRKAKPPPFPQRCASKRGECLPPAEWVKKLCDDIYPDLALHLFAPKTPWKRLYMLARADAFNASGGMSLVGDQMQPGEEVIALRRRNNDGPLRVGENAGYDVFRWNGACATIHDGDFTTTMPNEVRHSGIEWRRLGLPLRQALEAEPTIGEVYETRHEKCKGKSMGIVSADCEKYDLMLIDEVVRYVKRGGKVPQPTKLP